jgi:Flp pilus assembly protein TadG
VIRLSQLATRFRRSQDGVAALEMSLVGGLFVIGLLNGGELGRYTYEKMMADTSAQAGAAAALASCDVAHVPATVSCPALASAVNTGIHSTNLGTGVSLNGALSEGYYCLNNSHALVYVSDVSSPPAPDCSAVSNPSGTPALYLLVSTKFTYTPMFKGLTVVDALPSTFTDTSWMRMK